MRRYLVLPALIGVALPGMVFGATLSLVDSTDIGNAPSNGITIAPGNAGAGPTSASFDIFTSLSTVSGENVFTIDYFLTVSPVPGGGDIRVIANAPQSTLTNVVAPGAIVFPSNLLDPTNNETLGLSGTTAANAIPPNTTVNVAKLTIQLNNVPNGTYTIGIISDPEDIGGWSNPQGAVFGFTALNSYTVTVPEPASVASLACAGVFPLVLRRRRLPA